MRLTVCQPHSLLLAKFQFAQKSPRHRRPQCPNIEPCFQDRYVLDCRLSMNSFSSEGTVATQLRQQRGNFLFVGGSVFDVRRG